MQSNNQLEASRKGLLAKLLLFCCGLLTPLLFSSWTLANDGIANALRGKLDSEQRSGKLWVGCELIRANTDLITFYSEREFAPLWVNEQGLNDLGKNLPAQLADSRLHGLNPNDYHLPCLNATITRLNSLLGSQKQLAPTELAELDILMTDAFMLYASHLATGKVDPELLYPLWLSEAVKADVVAGLNDLLRTGDVAQTLRSFAPAHEQYWRLVAAAQRMEQVIAVGGWPELPDGRTLRPGERDAQVSLLRRRLQASGELEQNDAGAEPDRYDEHLAAAVRNFQSNHCLATDGVVGPTTRQALNVPAEQRRQQILLNLERWRWLPHQWGDNYIIVNTAAFSLTAHRPDETLTMRVIVGKDYQKTPVFSERMRYIEVNPYWNVPRSIAVKELLPEIRRNPGYVTRHNYQIVTGEYVIDPWKVDWQSVGAGSFPWRIRQKPGAKNALGRIKFMFPNRFNVYMHDTPDRHLFQRARRAFSHGCIRVEKPIEMALLVLQDDPAWTRERLEQMIESGQRRVINVHSDWMVHILYWTAWVAEDGQLRFCQDIYDRDPVLWQALNKTSAAANPLASAKSP